MFNANNKLETQLIEVSPKNVYGLMTSLFASQCMMWFNHYHLCTLSNSEQTGSALMLKLTNFCLVSIRKLIDLRALVCTDWYQWCISIWLMVNSLYVKINKQNSFLKKCVLIMLIRCKQVTLSKLFTHSCFVMPKFKWLS